MQTEAQLESYLSEPSAEVVEVIAALEGDILILGVGGKMGPTLAKQAKRAINAAGVSKKVIGVSRFSTPGVRETLHETGIETIVADLLSEDCLQNLPDTENVILMAGRKFGSTDNENLTWAMNGYMPGRVAEKFRSSRLVVFSTGNVYPLTPVSDGGATENSPVAPMGEYAQSCLSRERICSYFSSQLGTLMAILRLNYAIDLRYGILLDIAEKVYAEEVISLKMGNVNVIWQGDANAVALRAFAHCQSPPLVLNVTGPETVSVRYLASCFGRLFNKVPRFEDEEASTALLSNAAQCHQLFGYPRVSLGQMIEWVAEWVQIGGTTLRKPTHFEVRDGKF
ncbi:NAD(P)-dependent oxidoreductase [Candidatus Poribacteria bacterium]|nr:NAD(P)-dependent oxidoreductase [Candidatus Poribacteria bacterium]MYH82480.1 NAD(P)-dependent oxidoreductase [Candidatus Poribacteria bacterium]MYK95727.1 NAD(P)-dependent oxidoreductase [Candidatus Poribacteria bacterium]